jgi:Xaa-Pro aminopeptidase
MVDAGTLELVRGASVEVVSSAELIQAFEARWSPAALESHLEAGRRYYDITWTGVCGEPSAEMRKVFGIVRAARDAAIHRVQKAVAAGQAICGFEVDDAARGVIDQAGFGDFFVHRTGHSIGQDVHGNGANMDNLETHDERRVTPWTCFSVEPGIYLRDFGVRSEINLFVGDGEARVTGEIQTELLIL